MNIISVDYFAESGDEKPAGKIVVRTDTLVACYTIPGYSKRSMLLTEQGLKFCVKGRPDEFWNHITDSKDAPELLEEAAK